MAKKEKEFTYEMLMQSFKDARIELAEMREQQRKTDKKMAKLSENIGGIDRSNGLFAEETIFNVLEKDKTFCGIKFDYIEKNIQIQSENLRTLSEVDLLMVNGDHIAIIETKYKVENKDITKLITKQLKDFRACYPKYKNHKILLGIGGLSFEKNAMEKAQDNGIGIIKIVGDKLEFHTEKIKMY